MGVTGPLALRSLLFVVAKASQRPLTGTASVPTKARPEFISEGRVF